MHRRAEVAAAPVMNFRGRMHLEMPLESAGAQMSAPVTIG